MTTTPATTVDNDRDVNLGARMSPKQLKRAGVSSLLFLVVLAFVFFNTTILDFPVSNQVTYNFRAYVDGFDLHDLANDWFYSTEDPNVILTWMLARLYSVFDSSLVANSVLTTVLLAGAVSSMFQLLRLAIGPVDSRDAWLLTLGVSMVIFVPLNYLGLLSGVAGQSIFPLALIPSSFGVLALPALVAFAYGRNSVTTILLAAIPLFHPGSISISLVLFLAILIRWGQTGKWRTAVGNSLLFLSILGPFSLWTLARFDSGTQAAVLRASEIIALERIPHHALPSVWFDGLDLVNLAVLVAVLVYSAKRPALADVRHVLFYATLVSVVLTFAVSVSDQASLYLYFPWRVSGVLFFVANFLALAMISGALPVLHHRFSKAGLMFGVSVYFLSVMVSASTQPKAINFSVPTLSKSVLCGSEPYCTSEARAVRREFGEVSEWAISHTDGQSVFVLPTTAYSIWDEFRIRADRPTFVEWKNNPYAPQDVIEWRRRIAVIRAVYGSGPADCTSRVSKAKSTGAHFLVIDKSLCSDPEYVVFETDSMVVVDLEDGPHERDSSHLDLFPEY